MTDLRKAAEMALETLERLDRWLALRYGSELTPPEQEVVKALRQALAQPEQGSSSPNYPISESSTPFVDAVNISQERVDETAKREHEPVAWMWKDGSLTSDPDEADGTWIKLYTAPPISDYHEGWEEGFKAATLEHEPFIYVREDNERPCGGYEHCSEADAGAFPVYTAPPKREWVGLTEYQRLKFADRFHISGESIEAIEAKLKERNS